MRDQCVKTQQLSLVRAVFVGLVKLVDHGSGVFGLTMPARLSWLDLSLGTKN